MGRGDRGGIHWVGLGIFIGSLTSVLSNSFILGKRTFVLLDQMMLRSRHYRCIPANLIARIVHCG